MRTDIHSRSINLAQNQRYIIISPSKEKKIRESELKFYGDYQWTAHRQWSRFVDDFTERNDYVFLIDKEQDSRTSQIVILHENMEVGRYISETERLLFRLFGRDYIGKLKDTDLENHYLRLNEYEDSDRSPVGGTSVTDNNKEYTFFVKYRVGVKVLSVISFPMDVVKFFGVDFFVKRWEMQQSNHGNS